MEALIVALVLLAAVAAAAWVWQRRQRPRIIAIDPDAAHPRAEPDEHSTDDEGASS